MLFNLYYKDNTKPKWMKNDTKCIINNEERFNKEILDYVESITFDENLADKREETEKILNECIHQKYKTRKVLKFGSDSQGISHIFSDLDFEIISKEIIISDYENEIYYLKQISNIIGKEKKFTTKIIRAKVPIVEAICCDTNIHLDISVGRENGYKDSEIIKNIISKHIILKQAIIILKIYLKVKRLNDTRNGGVSSFLLFHLVYFFFKDEIEQRDYEKITIFDFLANLLSFYSKFENEKYSLLISENDVLKINKVGNNELSVISYLQKYKIDEHCKNKDEIENHDIGKKCKKFNEMKKSFGYFYNQIISSLNQEKFSLLYNLQFINKK